MPGSGERPRYAAPPILFPSLVLLMRLLLICLAALALLPPRGAVGESAHRSLPCQVASPIGTGQTEWKQIQLDGAHCAFETPYRLYYRPGSEPDRLLIYFQGGGACWDWVSCSGMFDTSVGRHELSDYRGIFDFTNPDNPFAEYTVVFVPYCTGDVHVGDTVQVYGEDAGGRPVHHQGARNVEQVLVWTKAQIQRPRHVVIAGASAGSYGAIFHTPQIARLYPSADIVTIGDSGVPLLNNSGEVLGAWGAHHSSLKEANVEAATARSVRAVVQVTSDQDAIQSAFYLISGSRAWRESSYELLNGLEGELSNFFSFIVAGTDHGLMRTDAFYEYESSGVRLSKWVRKLIAGERVESVRCETCVFK